MGFADAAVSGTHVTDWMPGPFALPAGHAEFAVGDCHGYLCHLLAVLAVSRELAPMAHLTLLGDLADRGPDSMGTLAAGIDAVHEYEAARGGGTLLPGNHEQMLLGTLADPSSAHGEMLMMNGGEWLADLELDGLTLERAVREALGARRFETLSQGGRLMRRDPGVARLHRRIGNVVLVHAGIDPFRADPIAWIEESDPTDMTEDSPLWIRDGFLDHKAAFAGGLCVVHGHSPEFRTARADGRRAAPGTHAVDGFRLGLDGGSFSTGIVTGAIIEDGRYRIITASGGGRDDRAAARGGR